MKEHGRSEAEAFDRIWFDADEARAFTAFAKFTAKVRESARRQGIEEAAKMAEGNWDAMSNTLSQEYKLRHGIAAAIRSLTKD